METNRGLRFRLRSCRRCGGDAYLEDDLDDSTWRCLQCGRRVDFVRTRKFSTWLKSHEPLEGLQAPRRRLSSRPGFYRRPTEV